MTMADVRRELGLLLEAAPPAVQPLGQSAIVLYGGGGKGIECLRLLRNAGYEVMGIVDRRQLQPIDGVPTYLPDDPALGRLAKAGATAIVSVFNYQVDPLPIHELLSEIGFQRVVGMVELRQLLPVPNTYWLAESSRMIPSAEDASWLWERLADDESRRCFVEAVALRRTFNPRRLRDLSPCGQYLPATVPVPRHNLRFVDGGAFDGDTIAGLLEGGCSVSALAAFEPDPANYSKLCRRVGELGLTEEMSLWPCGLDAVTRQLRFRSDADSSSGFDIAGDVIVQTVSFDDAMPSFNPSYVKLDIEGAEADALRGMANTIRSARPALAVCVYHRPADLWELPYLVDGLMPEYRLYLRAHTWNGFELVLYAIP